MLKQGPQRLIEPEKLKTEHDWMKPAARCSADSISRLLEPMTLV
jgi:hypothetical protein